MKIRNCVICGSSYDYCPRCKQYESLPKWKISYCSEKCYNIYMTINKYAFNHITAEEAYNALGNIENMNIINDEINSLIYEIKTKYIPEVEEIKPKKKKDKKVENLLDEENVNLD